MMPALVAVLWLAAANLRSEPSGNRTWELLEPGFALRADVLGLAARNMAALRKAPPFAGAGGPPRLAIEDQLGRQCTLLGRLPKSGQLGAEQVPPEASCPIDPSVVSGADPCKSASFIPEHPPGKAQDGEAPSAAFGSWAVDEAEVAERWQALQFPAECDATRLQAFGDAGGGIFNDVSQHTMYAMLTMRTGLTYAPMQFGGQWTSPWYCGPEAANPGVWCYFARPTSCLGIMRDADLSKQHKELMTQRAATRARHDDRTSMVKELESRVSALKGRSLIRSLEDHWKNRGTHPPSLLQHEADGVAVARTPQCNGQGGDTGICGCSEPRYYGARGVPSTGVPDAWAPPDSRGSIWLAAVTTKLLWGTLSIATQDFVDNVASSIGFDPTEEPTIGMHVRLGDTKGSFDSSKRHNAQTFEDYLQPAREMKAKYGWRRIFLATDDAPTAEACRQNTEFTCVTAPWNRGPLTPDEKNATDVKAHYLDKTRVDRAEISLTAVADVELLSRCSAFVGTFGQGAFSLQAFLLMLGRQQRVVPYACLQEGCADKIRMRFG